MERMRNACLLRMLVRKLGEKKPLERFRLGVICNIFVGYFTTLSIAGLYSVENNEYKSMMNWRVFRRKRSWPTRDTIPTQRKATIKLGQDSW
jgi:hypothetical protein